MKHCDITVLLFDGFEPLDVFGPAEVFGALGRLEGSPVETRLRFASVSGGIQRGSFECPVETEPLARLDAQDVVLIPGGLGTRALVDDDGFIDVLRPLAEHCKHCLTVCTGSALLAATGLLDGRSATSNKRSWDWVVSTRPEVDWRQRARWVTDGKFVTSSGVSAGIDMALGFVADQYGVDIARGVAKNIEYRWNEDSNDDPFGQH